MKNFLLSIVFAFGFFQVYSINTFSIIDPSLLNRKGPGLIKNVEIKLTPKSSYMQFDVTMTLSPVASPDILLNDTFEALLFFSLPKNSFITDSWLWIEDYISKAELISGKQATTIYEGIVRRKRDPSLLTKEKDGFQLRVYPVMLSMPRKVKISYMVPMNWIRDKISVPLPLEILKMSDQSFDISVAFKSDTVFSNFTISQFDSMPTIDSFLNGYSYYTISSAKYSTLSRLTVTASKPDGSSMLSIIAKDSTEGYFECLLDLHKMLGSNSRKICLVIENFDGSDQTFPNSLEYVNYLKKSLLDEYTDMDSFMLVYATGDDTVPENPVSVWLPFTKTNINLYFDNRMAATILNGRFATKNLLVKASNIIHLNNSGGEVMLLTNLRNQLGSLSMGDYMNDIRNQTDTNIQVNVLNYYKTHYLTNIRSFSNAELGIQICRLTKGVYNDFSSLTPTYSPYSTSDLLTADALFEKQYKEEGKSLASIYSFDISAVGGFILDKFQSFTTEPLRDNDDVRLSGHYIGSPELSIQFNMLTDTGVFTYNFTPFEYYTDSCIIQTHMANKYLLPSDIAYSSLGESELTQLSIENKVLSRRTAFLALEQVDTVLLWIYHLTTNNEGTLHASTLLATDPSFVVYPNPFNTNFIISSTEEITEIRLYDLLGNLVESQSMPVATSLYSFDLSGQGTIASGLYLLKIYTKNTISTVRIVKE